MKHLYYLLLLVLVSTVIKAQTIMDVARSKEITWYGIDFSKARFIGFGNEITPDALTGELIPQWQSFTESIDFSKKYKTKVNKMPREAQQRNAAIVARKMIVNNYYEIHPDTIADVVLKYETTGSGFGFLFLVESFEKSTDKAYVYVCFFNEPDRKIISVRRYIGKASGRNLIYRDKLTINSIVSSSCKDFKQYKKK